MQRVCCRAMAERPSDPPAPAIPASRASRASRASPAPPRAHGSKASNAPFVAILAVMALILAAGAGAYVILRPAAPKLCPGTPKLLASLRSPVTVDAYVTRGMPRLDRFVASLRLLLDEYRAQSGGRFSYRVIEVRDDETRKQAKELGLAEQPFASDNDAQVSLVTGMMGLVFHYENEKEVIASMPIENTSGLEFWIDNKIRQLRAKVEGTKVRIGILVGHGEMEPRETNLLPVLAGRASIQGIMTQNFPFYAFEDADLRRSGPIDPDLQGLIVTQPSVDLSQGDLERIDAFVMRGKPVAFFVGAANVKAGDPSMRATLSAHGIERLLAGYGVELGRDLVVEPDPKSALSFTVQTASGTSRLVVPFVPIARDEDHSLDPSFPVFFRMKEVAFPYPSSIVVHRDKQPEATIREIAWSSPKAVRVTADEVDVHPLKPWTPAGPEGQFVLAVAIDGTVQSAVGTTHKSQARARVLVVASSEFLANPFARACNAVVMPSAPIATTPTDESLARVAGPYAQQELTATILAFKNTVDWLSYEDDLVDCSLLADGGR